MTTAMTAAGSRPQSTRERILYAALQVIGAHGIAGLTNRLVAKQAGISLGSLTYHFASQTDLLRESLLVFVADETQRISAIADSLQYTVGGVEEAASRAERAITEIVLGPAEIGVYEVYLQAARDHQLHDAARECFAAYDSVAATILTMLGVADVDGIAPHVVALVAGFQLRRLATGAQRADGIAEGLLLLIGAGQHRR